MPPTPRARGRFTLWASMALAAAALSIAAGEIVARVFISAALPVQIGAGATALTADETRVAFEPDPELIWRLRENVQFPDGDLPLRGTISNAQHLRAASTISDAKADNELRILFIGDSITFGWRVRHDETFAHRTQQVMRERFPSVQTTSLNAGVPAYTVFQGWRFLETRGFDFEPDIVVIGSFGFNESTSWSGLSDFDQSDRWQRAQAPTWLRWSGLARAVTSRLYSSNDSAGSSVAASTRPRLDRAEFRDLLGRVREACRKRQVELLVVVPGHIENLDGTLPPDTLGPYQRELARFGDRLHLGSRPEPARVDGVAILQKLAAHYTTEQLMFDHVHPTAIVHAALGDSLAAALTPWMEAKLSAGHFGSTESSHTVPSR